MMKWMFSELVVIAMKMFKHLSLVHHTLPYYNAIQISFGFINSYAYSTVVSSPDPTLSQGKGLVTMGCFLCCAESAVLFSGKPIRLQILLFVMAT